MIGAQLWKRILFEGIKNPHGADIQRAIICAPIIVDERICDAAEPDSGMIRRLIGGGTFLSGYSLLNNCFPTMWIEGAVETKVGRKSIGCLVDSHSSSWTISTFCSEAGDPPYFTGNVSFNVDENHSPVGQIELGIPPEISGITGQKSAMYLALRIATCALDVMHMLGCKNIYIESQDGDPKTSRTAAKRFGGEPGKYRYHILMVRPTKGNGKHGDGIPLGVMPWHVARGHWCHYGPAIAHGHPDKLDRGLLFGLYAGRYWIDPAWKGDKKNGIVEKDYAIA